MCKSKQSLFFSFFVCFRPFLKEIIILIHIFNFFPEIPLNNESSPQAQLPTSFAISQTDDEGLLQLEPPSEYSFSLHDQENLDDIFESFPF